jgi:hypothetical protein
MFISYGENRIIVLQIKTLKKLIGYMHVNRDNLKTL